LEQKEHDFRQEAHGEQIGIVHIFITEYTNIRSSQRHCDTET